MIKLTASDFIIMWLFDVLQTHFNDFLSHITSKFNVTIYFNDRLRRC